LPRAHAHPGAGRLESAAPLQPDSQVRLGWSDVLI
jgi:hypothetical protein